MSFDIPPDPDFREADADPKQLQDAGNLLTSVGDAIKTAAARTHDTNHGDGIDDITSATAKLVEQLTDAGDAAKAAVVLHDSLHTAADTFRHTAPTVEECQAALARYNTAVRVYYNSSSGHAAAAQAEKDAAKADLESKLADRRAAIDTYERSDEAARAVFAATLDQIKSNVTHNLGLTVPGAPPPTAPAPEPAPAPAPAPGTPPGSGQVIPLPDPGATPPLAGLGGNAGNSGGGQSGGGASTLDPSSVALGAALAQRAAAPQAMQQPAQPMQQAMPQLPTQPPQGQPQQQQRDQNALGLNTSDVNELLRQLREGDGAVPGLVPAPIGGLVGGGGGTAPVTYSSPQLSPINVPATPPVAPQLQAGNGLTPLAGPTPPGTVTGTSIQGLQTEANVTGRSQPVPGPLTANPAAAGAQTATHLSNASPAGGGGGAAPGAVGQPGMGGMPYAPMMGGVPGGGSVGPRDKDSDPILAYTGDQATAHGMHAVADAVPAATLARQHPEYVPPISPSSAEQP